MSSLLPHRVISLLLLTGAVACDPGPDFDDAFDIDPWQDGTRVPPAPDAFAHAGTWTGVCRLESRAPFQVEITLDAAGTGSLARHDEGPSHAAAVGRSETAEISVIAAMFDDVLFRVDLHTLDAVVEGICYELVQDDDDDDDDDDGMLCPFPEIGCPSTPMSFGVVARGELVLVRVDDRS